MRSGLRTLRARAPRVHRRRVGGGEALPRCVPEANEHVTACARHRARGRGTDGARDALEDDRQLKRRGAEIHRNKGATAWLLPWLVRVIPDHFAVGRCARGPGGGSSGPLAVEVSCLLPFLRSRLSWRRKRESSPDAAPV